MIYTTQFVNIDSEEDGFGTIPTGDTYFPFLFEVKGNWATHIWSGSERPNHWEKYKVASWMIVVDGT